MGDNVSYAVEHLWQLDCGREMSDGPGDAETCLIPTGVLPLLTAFTESARHVSDLKLEVRSFGVCSQQPSPSRLP